MKRIVLAVILTLGIMCFVGCDQQQVKFETQTSSSTETRVTEVQEGTTTIKIPKEFVYSTSQTQIDQVVQENGYNWGYADEDGGVYYNMSDGRWEQLVSDTAKGFESDFATIVENYEAIDGIFSNENYTKYTVKVNREITLTEKAISNMFYDYSNLYACVTNTELTEVVVEYVDKDSSVIYRNTFTDIRETSDL